MESMRPRLGRGPRRESSSRDIQPLWVVHGGLQATAVRRLLVAAPGPPTNVVGTPSTDTMTDADVAETYRRLNSADIVVTEDIPAGHRGLPIGTADILPHVRPGVPVIRFPRFLYAGIHPYQVPAAPGTTPPLVPYHDLRTVAVAARLTSHEAAWEPLDPDKVREFAAWQLLGMRLRESSGVGPSGAVRRAGVEATHTVNRPGNSLLVTLTRAVQTAAGVPATAQDPGVPLLSRYTAPVDDDIAEALGFPAWHPKVWSIAGRLLRSDLVREAHMRFYRANPDIMKAVLAAESRRMEMLELV